MSSLEAAEERNMQKTGAQLEMPLVTGANAKDTSMRSNCRSQFQPLTKKGPSWTRLTCILAGGRCVQEGPFFVKRHCSN